MTTNPAKTEQAIGEIVRNLKLCRRLMLRDTIFYPAEQRLEWCPHPPDGWRAMLSDGLNRWKKAASVLHFTPYSR
jgi:hypothetical protein